MSLEEIKKTINDNLDSIKIEREEAVELDLSHYVSLLYYRSHPENFTLWYIDEKDNEEYTQEFLINEAFEPVIINSIIVTQQDVDILLKVVKT